MQKFRVRFSILTLLLVTMLVAFYMASRDTDWLSLNMDGNDILPLPIDSYPNLPGHWGLLNPKELPLDRILCRQCLKFEKLSPKDQEAVRNSICASTKESLWKFASRSAVFALRNKDPERIRGGLNALAMVPNVHDPRDVVRTHEILNQAVHELQVDTAMLQEIGGIAEPHSDEMMPYIINPSRIRSPRFVQTEFGSGFVAVDKGPFDPKSNLLSVGMRIAAAIEKTDSNYKANSFKIGSKARLTSTLRLEDLNMPVIEKQVLSAVQLRATIDPKCAKYQQFVVDVYELSSKDSVEKLQAAADKQAKRSIRAILTVSHEGVFCIIRARSYAFGGKNYETKESLRRFAEPISRVLAE